MSNPIPSVLLVGGGASAVAVTQALYERAERVGAPTPRVTVVGREPAVGRGLAYGHAEAHHRLNATAGKMSVSAEKPDDLLDYLDAVAWRDLDGSPATAETFVPRPVFGDYLEDRFLALQASKEVAFVQGDVVDVRVDADGTTAVLGDGTELTADAVVLALGNPAPGRVASGATTTIDDPWATDALTGITADQRILLIGTGLTMIDVATSLARTLPGIRLTATSRRLLLPAVHLDGPAAPGPGLRGDAATLGQMISAYGAQIREAKRAGSPWQPVLDGIRPQIQTLWQSLSLADRERFLEHVARRWDVHRHRMAPSVWAELSGLIDAGTLTLAAEVRHADFDVAINCTGPASVAAAGWSPLVDSLLDAGVVRSDPTGIGFDADAAGALISTNDEVSPRLFSIGASLKGALWETVAVPELRLVAGRIADRLAQHTPVAAA